MVVREWLRWVVSRANCVGASGLCQGVDSLACPLGPAALGRQQRAGEARVAACSPSLPSTRCTLLTARRARPQPHNCTRPALALQASRPRRAPRTPPRLTRTASCCCLAAAAWRTATTTSGCWTLRPWCGARCRRRGRCRRRAQVSPGRACFEQGSVQCFVFDTGWACLRGWGC